MKEITEDYVSRETYKLLKEKEYNGEVWTGYDTEGYTCPAIHLYDAMKWLREEHHLYVWISYNFNHTGLPWYYEIFDVKNRKVVKIGGVECGSYEKTCEIAIEECLKNLI